VGAVAAHDLGDVGHRGTARMYYARVSHSETVIEPIDSPRQGTINFGRDGQRVLVRHQHCSRQRCYNERQYCRSLESEKARAEYFVSFCHYCKRERRRTQRSHSTMISNFMQKKPTAK
jgi:hypothetical protein